MSQILPEENILGGNSCQPSEEVESSHPLLRQTAQLSVCLQHEEGVAVLLAQFLPCPHQRLCASGHKAPQDLPSIQWFCSTPSDGLTGGVRLEVHNFDCKFFLFVSLARWHKEEPG